MCTVVLGHNFLKQPTSRMFFWGHASWKRNPQRSPKSRKHINDTKTHSNKWKINWPCSKAAGIAGRLSQVVSPESPVGHWLSLLFFFFPGNPQAQISSWGVYPQQSFSSFSRCPHIVSMDWRIGFKENLQDTLWISGPSALEVAVLAQAEPRPAPLAPMASHFVEGIGDQDIQMVGGVILFCFMELQSSLFFSVDVWSDLKNFHSWITDEHPATWTQKEVQQWPPKIGPPGNAPCDQLVAAWGTLWWIRHGLLDNHPGWGWFSTLKTSISSGFPPCPVWWP